MTLVHDNLKMNEAQVHALIIGVGKYPYLHGGNRKLTSRSLGLGQLTSPPVSARYFCKWFLEEYNNPDRPLGSVEILLSEVDPKPFVLPKEEVPQEIESATISAVRRASSRWLERCQAHPDNLAVFYFCGHGTLLGESNLLLLEDYGHNENAEFQGAIDSDKLQRAVGGFVPGHKCLFIDACSNVPINDLDIIDPGADGLFTITRMYSFLKRLTVLRAAVEGSSAYGEEDKPSRFTQALVNCLNGRAAKKENNIWIITNETLTSPLGTALREINNAEGGIPQVYATDANSGTVLLQVLKNTPKVPLLIEFVPTDAIDAVQLKLVADDNPEWKLVYPSSDGTWRLFNSHLESDEIPAGVYRLTAQFQNKTYKEKEPLIIFHPGPTSKQIRLEPLQ